MQRKTVVSVLTGGIVWLVVVLVVLTLAGCGGAVGEPRKPTEDWDPGFQPTKRWVPMQGGVQAEGSTPSSLGMAPEDEFLEDVRRAEDGSAFYQLFLGIRYLRGDGVPKNDAEAIKWFRMAAEQGQTDAQFYLSSMYISGSGVPQNLVEAGKWARMAAERGHATSQYFLGSMYKVGHSFGVGYGMPQDLVQAYAWFNIAATQGHEDAVKEREDLDKTMTGEQRARAQELSREYWKAYVLPFRRGIDELIDEFLDRR